MKSKKIYILYEYNKMKDDYNNLKEFYNIKELQKEFNFKNKNSIYQYIKKEIDTPNKKLINDKYIVISECI